MLLYVLKHPVAANVVLMTTRDAVQPTVIRDHRAAELGNVVLKVNQVLALLVADHVIEMDVLVPPLEVVDDSLVGELLLDDEEILKEVDDSFIDIEVIKLGNHRLLVLKIFLKLVNESVAFIDHASDVVKDLGVSVFLQFRKCVIQSLIFALFPLQLVVH